MAFPTLGEILTPLKPKELPLLNLASKCSPGVSRANLFNMCPIRESSALYVRIVLDVYQIWCKSVQPFDSFPRLEFVTPKIPLNAPCCI